MPYAKMIYVFGFLSICQNASLPERQFARAPVSPERQFAKVLVSFARAPECQFCHSASFARAPVLPVLPERQFCQSASFARAPVLPERQFCQSASFARVPVLPVSPVY
jgi:hypothetical protein